MKRVKSCLEKMCNLPHIVAKAKDDVVNVNYVKCRRKQETEETQRKCASKDGL